MKKRLLILICFVLLVGSVALVSDGFTNWDLDYESSLSIKENTVSMKVKLLREGKDENGHDYQEYNYSVLPTDTTNKNVILKEKKWSKTSSLNIDEYLTVEINNTNSTFKITSLKASSTQATIILCCQEDENVKAQMTIDWRQKWLGYNQENPKVNLFDLKKNCPTSVSIVDDSLAHKIGIYDSSSDYTIARDVTYTVNRGSVTYSTFKANTISNNVTIVDNPNQITSYAEYSSEVIDRTFFGNYSLLYEDLCTGIFKDTSEWSNSRRIEILRYKYYGYKIVYNCTFKCEQVTKQQEVELYFFLEVSDLGVNVLPQSLVLDVENIIF